jgi:ribonuclease HI
MGAPTITAIYTDGACSGNPGPGGWGVMVEFSNGDVHELGGAARATTNNRMELQAAIAALEYFQDHKDIHPDPRGGLLGLHTDSEYVIKGITQWIKGWKRKGWKTAQGKPVLNQDLWETLDRLNSPVLSWTYVRGHAGVPGNERCDTIARGYSLGRLPKLRQREFTENDAFSGFSAVEHTSPTEDCLESSYSQLDLGDRVTNAMDAISISAQENGVDLPREARVAQVRNQVEMLRIADEIAQHSYLISSSELADLMDVNASAVTSRGEQWVWRNWLVSRVRREGNQILWQLERVDQ